MVQDEPRMTPFAKFRETLLYTLQSMALLNYYAFSLTSLVLMSHRYFEQVLAIEGLIIHIDIALPWAHSTYARITSQQLAFKT
jgi:hypothetical protein